MELEPNSARCFLKVDFHGDSHRVTYYGGHREPRGNIYETSSLHSAVMPENIDLR